MSKHEKTSLELSGTDAELTATAPDFTGESAQSAEQASAKTRQSRHFNDWLDRALPMLQDRLSDLGTSNITTPEAKPKH